MLICIFAYCYTCLISFDQSHISNVYFIVLHMLLQRFVKLQIWDMDMKECVQGARSLKETEAQRSDLCIACLFLLSLILHLSCLVIYKFVKIVLLDLCSLCPQLLKSVQSHS